MKYGKNSKKDKYAIHEVQMNLENISVKIRRLMKRITKKKKKHKQTNKKVYYIILFKSRQII